MSDDLSRILYELGEDRETYASGIAPPIFPSTNYAFPDVASLRAAFQAEFSTHIYARGNHPTGDILRKKLAALDGAEDALLFNSGAAAIFAAVTSQVRSGDHIVSVARPYSWAQRTFDLILGRFGVETTYVDGVDPENFARACRPNTRLFYLETPNTWDFAIQDLACVAEIARSRGIVTVCDNTYATPLRQRPIAFGIDLVLQSATKYIGGHGDAVAGVLCGTRARLERIFEREFMAVGSGIQPFNAWLLLRGLRTLPARLERNERSAAFVSAWLGERPEVESVLYPFDPDFPQYALARKQMTGAGGLLSFVLRAERVDEIEGFCARLKHIPLAVSWGGYESLLIPRCATIRREDFDPRNREHRMVRLYVGLEDPGLLIEDLARGFDSRANP